VVSVFVAVFAFVTFTGKPMECFSVDKNRNKLNDNQNFELQQKISRNNVLNNEYNNNSHPLMQRQYNEPEVELRPRPRLPGILHFMFES